MAAARTVAIEAGRLRHRVRIERPENQQSSGLGEVAQTWRLVAHRWAEVEPLSGRELLAAQQVQSAVTHRVRLRHCAALSPAMRVLHRGRALHIESVIHTAERGRETILLCTEQTT